jgi:hypothetical protein
MNKRKLANSIFTYINSDRSSAMMILKIDKITFALKLITPYLWFYLLSSLKDNEINILFKRYKIYINDDKICPLPELTANDVLVSLYEILKTLINAFTATEFNV